VCPIAASTAGEASAIRISSGFSHSFAVPLLAISFILAQHLQTVKLNAATCMLSYYANGLIVASQGRCDVLPCKTTK
jgi:hypothetical protein